MTIARIISGGQSGVDIAALRAAKTKRVPTGGAMPRGWRTLAGAHPEYEALYGMHEHRSAEWKPRTYENVKASDITIRIAVDFQSNGEVCTMNAIEHHGRPHYDIPVRRENGGLIVAESDIFDAVWKIEEVAGTILSRHVTVNIAGNSERTSPGIERYAEGIVMMLIDAECGM